MKGPPKIIDYPQKLTTQRQKSFESHLSSTLMQVKLVRDKMDFNNVKLAD